jgi:DNA polymerase type B, organellar and viral
VPYDLNNISIPEYFIEIKNTKLLISLRIKGNELFSFEDELYILSQEGKNLSAIRGESNLTTFTRKLQNTKYLFVEGQENLMIKNKKVSFISPKKNKDSFKGANFITMDLETKAQNGKLIPYCVSIFNGKTVSSFYITDFNNSNEMLENAIKSLMRKEYNGYKVYLHNFSYFDGIFLLSIITSLSQNVKILIRDSRIIDLKVNFGNKNKIYFRDSLLMIPISLAKAAKSFNVEDKGYFPYKFVNKPEITYNYIGPVPSYEYFEADKVTENAYKEYIKEYNGVWDLEKETIKYCEQDCITLYQILQKFSKFIYDEFKINFLNSPTLSSLAFLIYRTNFMEELNNKLPILTGKIYKKH